MSTSVEALVEPLYEEHPCGEDIGYDPQYLELDGMLLGKEETQFAAAEEPDWKAVVARCLELFRRSKDLRVAVRLTLGWLQTNGLSGFRDGLKVINEMLGQYWDSMYPRLDPDDNNDPLERVNLIASLTTPAGTFGDPMQFLKRLRLAPLADSPQMGKLAMVDIERSVTGVPTPDGSTISPDHVKAAFRSTRPEVLQAICEATNESIALVAELDDRLTRAVGNSKAVNFEPLVKVLKELQKALAPYAGETTEVAQISEGEPASYSPHVPASAVGGSVNGSLNTRQDVIRVLDQICDFYKRTEPSSPVPLLLQRARRLVDMDFMQLLEELTPEALNQLKVITGFKHESTGETEE